MVPTAQLHPGLEHLLQVRQTLGLRNSAHSLVKLLAPTQTSSLLVTSYTHPEYLETLGAYFMSAATAARGDAFLMRGTEGETVANPHRGANRHPLSGTAPAASRPASSQTRLVSACGIAEISSCV